ncbi:type I inositol-1,4,5-trisphosphate 5-phosphatase CVP2 [Plectosphaerella plurivora]|uniref:Type I inositol-1,4,5-trisphosphate 5-phosphatase CVP2 n=1 Tax=Plectosphaerella plurivora TaxID=936078 RepID=A0A9P8V938_9PEZI|nr:type I inositol-1,4,5-trisphosphate 5-phosphatase CVP2 [Plectosphaerella plurivora]
MASTNQNGPDGSSLKPVSSLRAKFENMQTNEPPPKPPTGPSPPRSISPGPKPDRFRDVRASQESLARTSTPPPVPKTKPERPLSSIHLPVPYDEPALRSPGRSLGPPPPLSPKPGYTAKTPAVMIEPPLSPPKAQSFRPHSMDAHSLLNPESSTAPSTPLVPNRPFKIPSRSSTPVLEPRRSPRLIASQPPSPPPPRRSGEIRRDFGKQPPPPPASRSDRPLIPAQPRASLQLEPHKIPVLEPRQNVRVETSPFSSPPSSPGSPDSPTPPLPTRPQQRQISPIGRQRSKTSDAGAGFELPPTRMQQRQISPTGLQRTKTMDVGFEPPPKHHSIIGRSREPEPLPPQRQRITPQLTGEERPAMPARPLATTETTRPVPVKYSTMKPPPRPPRPGLSSIMNPPDSAPPPKRIVSTPATQILPPPTRVPGRSNTVVERSTDRIFAPDVRANAPMAIAPIQAPIQAQAPPPKAAESQGSSYPDPSNINRRPPRIKYGHHEVAAKYDTRVFDVCGDLVCTTGALTRVWDMQEGEMLMSFAHGEGIKATAVAFKPGANVDEEGKRIWIGNNVGELLEADIATQTLITKKTNAHTRHEIIRIYRHFNELWSLDEGGTLVIWGPDEELTPNLDGPPSQTYRVPRGHTFSMVVGDQLWHATGREIRVFAPTMAGETQFQVLLRPLQADNAGEVSAGTLMRTHPDTAFFGHMDGKVSFYNTKDYSCLGVLNVSSFKISALAGVGDYMWAGFNNGQLSVYDMSQTPWIVKKTWIAHENPIIRLVADASSPYRVDRLQVVSLGADNMVRIWDGLLQDDWQESFMKAQEPSYCTFEDLKVMCMTWNAGASTPHSLRYDEQDAAFISNLLEESDSPDILVFGFQELVDLEDKTATAKRLFKSKKKEGSDQERMSHQYRDWRDFLMKSLDDHMRGELYHLLHTGTLVGLFTCIFVKASVRGRIKNLTAADVKRGMGGLHGNKGAIVVRFLLDDTSLCFVNCHLAAGQSQANSRHNDVAAILETPIMPAERDPNILMDSFTSGGDGSMVLDHELCLLNGDLNYRIDTMSRDTVVMAVKQNNLAKLLERDQLLVARRRNPGFRLRAFEELPITFAPTYKYDVGTDNYDTSEKRRSPAWCDRLLYRGRGRIKQLDYRRHEVRVSDHRPVTGRFTFTVKRIEPKARAKAWMDCQVGFEDLRAAAAIEEKMEYFTRTIGYDVATAKSLVKTRRDPSPSRTRTGE